MFARGWCWRHDDLRFSVADTLWIHARTGVRLIFDHQHHCCLNPEGLEAAEAFGRVLDTWPGDVRPKMHFSSPRTEMREVTRKDKKTGKPVTTLQEPVWTGHADFVQPFEFIRFMRDCGAGDRAPPVRRDAGGKGKGPGARAPAARPCALRPGRRRALRHPRSRGRA